MEPNTGALASGLERMLRTSSSATPSTRNDGPRALLFSSAALGATGGSTGGVTGAMGRGFGGSRGGSRCTGGSGCARYSSCSTTGVSARALVDRRRLVLSPHATSAPSNDDTATAAIKPRVNAESSLTHLEMNAMTIQRAGRRRISEALARAQADPGSSGRRPASSRWRGSSCAGGTVPRVPSGFARTTMVVSAIETVSAAFGEAGCLTRPNAGLTALRGAIRPIGRPRRARGSSACTRLAPVCRRE